MKKQIKTILISSAFTLLITACAKEANIESTIDDDASIQEMRAAYTHAKTNNDSLNYWYNHSMLDSSHCMTMMHHCDSMYHYQDSIMMHNYNKCHNSMSAGGGMMGGNNTTMDCTINGIDCTAMITFLHQQHIRHPVH